MLKFLLLALAFSVTSVAAQSAIFNVPSTDVQPNGSFSFEADLIVKPARYRNGGFQTYAYRAVWGTRGRSEVGANFFYTYDRHSAAQVQFNAKRRIYLNEKRGLAFSGGVLATLPLRAGPREKRDALFYVVGSKVIPQLKGTRVTGGTYGVLTHATDYGTRAGAIIAVEQPVYKKVSFLADWYSGKNKIGYSAAGIDLSITKRQYLIAGWNFGNYGRGNNAFSAFYGYVF